MRVAPPRCKTADYNDRAALLEAWCQEGGQEKVTQVVRRKHSVVPSRGDPLARACPCFVIVGGSCVQYQVVQLWQLCPCVPRERPHGLEVGEVHGESNADAWALGGVVGLGGCCAGAGLRPAGEHHVGPEGVEPLDCLEADALGAAGNDRVPALQRGRIVHAVVLKKGGLVPGLHEVEAQLVRSITGRLRKQAAQQPESEHGEATDARSAPKGGVETVGHCSALAPWEPGPSMAWTKPA
mmetsp:Transcript_107765/g.292142  ORF Transcript_107765/g.292142 Transcript_107765/m.292142 type:complete len:239 (+) Transcript_107765:745-1461(+)